MFPGAAEFNKLMVNSVSKVRQQKLMKKQLKHRVQFSVIYFGGETSMNLNTGVANTGYVFKHTEADTILLSAYMKLRTRDYTGTFVFDSDDTDVYVQTTYVSQKL